MPLKTLVYGSVNYFFYYAKCSTSYLAKSFLIHCHGSKKKYFDDSQQIGCCNKYTFSLPKVILTYPACDKEYKATLGEDLQTLSKALARKGTYKQRADAHFVVLP